jgi:xanthine/CO dehydrogenase XdhC/CoxF family maturation factor
MVDSRALLTVLDRLLSHCKEQGFAALATIVRTAGSTYRKSGARLAVAADGRTFGEISAGCLEADVAAAAAEARADGAPRLLHYDNGAPGEILWGLGLGCNGTIDVLVEPMEAGDQTASFYQRVAEELRGGDVTAVLATVSQAPEGDGPALGAHLFVGETGTVFGSLAGGEPSRQIEADAGALFAQPKTTNRRYETAAFGAVQVSLETVPPPTPLVVVGADPDSIPIVRLAAAAGFRVVVLDHRPTHATADRFPEAETVICCRAGDLAQAVSLDGRTFVIVKTHNYLADQEALAVVLPSAVRYVGQMGPTSRAEKLLADLEKEDVVPTREQIARFHAPVGLDLAPESADEIAVSIVGELLAVRSGRQGGFLRAMQERIHS